MAMVDNCGGDCGGRGPYLVARLPCLAADCHICRGIYIFTCLGSSGGRLGGRTAPGVAIDRQLDGRCHPLCAAATVDGSRDGGSSGLASLDMTTLTCWYQRSLRVPNVEVGTWPRRGAGRPGEGWGSWCGEMAPGKAAVDSWLVGLKGFGPFDHLLQTQKLQMCVDLVLELHKLNSASNDKRNVAPL